MRTLLTVFVCVLLATTASCRKDFSTSQSFGDLKFSKDTVFLDTVFSNIGSATYNLKVYNNSSKNITIPSIQLENGSTSNYRLNVDGIPGNTFENIDILANDSLYVFIETTIDFTSVSNPLYTDKILFDNGNNQQEVDLITLVQDATFIFPERDPFTLAIDNLNLDGSLTNIQGRFLLDEELIFTNEKPYVIYGYAAVPANKTLTVQAGARIYFHHNSGLIVDREATLNVTGTLDEQVLFEGDRLTHQFENVPGQWGTIWMRAGSIENSIAHTRIKNGTVGILVDSLGTPNTPTLTITDSQLYNHSGYGILGRATAITGKNVVIGNAGQAGLACTYGGNYEFTHCTFANYWTQSLRTLPNVLVNNHYTYYTATGEEVTSINDLQAANFTNCILEGNNSIEFVLDKVDGTVFNYTVQNCMVQFNDSNGSYTDNAEMDFEDTAHYQNILLNGYPHFKAPYSQEFIIGQDSDAINQANSSAAALLPFDILGVSRTSSPDIGAYQHIEFE